MGSLWSAKRSPGSFCFDWINYGTLKARRVHWGLRGFTRAIVMVSGFIRVRAGSLWRASPGSFGIALVHSGARSGRRIHSVSRGFSPTRGGDGWFYSGARSVRRVHLSSRCFILVRTC